MKEVGGFLCVLCRNIQNDYQVYLFFTFLISLIGNVTYLIKLDTSLSTIKSVNKTCAILSVICSVLVLFPHWINLQTETFSYVIYRKRKRDGSCRDN